MEEDFQSIAISSWHKTNSKPFHNITNTLAKDLKFWSKTKKPTHQQLSHIEQQITAIQSTYPSQREHNKEATLVHQHEHLMQKNAEYHRQLS